jgi:hypothetical protein
MSRTYVTFGFGASAEIVKFSADMEKCFSANMSRHRYLYRKQLNRSRDLKGGFVLDAEETQKMLAPQSITYPEIAGERRFHPERLRPQMEAQAEAWKKEARKAAEAQKADKSPPPVICSYFHEPRTNKIDFSYSQPFIETVGDCTPGYRTVAMDVLLSLRSRYSRLFFIYLSGSSKYFRFKEATVREMFGLEDCYRRFGSLKKRLECVKREFKRLDVDFRWEFREERGEKFLYIRSRGMEQYRPSLQEEKSDPADNRPLPEELVSFLKEKLDMDDAGINSNKKTFLGYIDFFGEEKLIAFLSEKMKDYGFREKHNPTGWLIAAVKGEVAKEGSTGRVEKKNGELDKMQYSDIPDPRVRALLERGPPALSMKNKLSSS